jgi:AcrR family transcriptional regulator
MSRQMVASDRILEGALSAIARFGVQKLSMVDVADQAGVSRGTLYRYFRTKEELLESLGGYVQRSMESSLAEVVAARPDLAKRAEVVIGFLWDFSRRPELDQLLELEPRFVRGFYRSHFAEFVQSVEDALRPLVPAKRKTPIPLRTVADVIVRMTLSYELADPGNRTKAVRTLVELVHHMLDLPPAAANTAPRPRRVRAAS